MSYLSRLPPLLRSPMKQLPLSIAQTRLKQNLLALGVLALFKLIFTPYQQLRRGVIWLIDDYVKGGSRRGSGPAESVIWSLESLLALIFLWNITEAYLSVKTPLAPPRIVNTPGIQLTPSRISSPLTRSYPQVNLNSSTKPLNSSRQQNSSSALTHSSAHNDDASRSSPLSQTTAEALNLRFRPKESTGLFFSDDHESSPSKAGRKVEKKPDQQEQRYQGGGNGGSPDDFVMIEREEKEWVDNVWKGVLGKGGKVGL